MKIIYLNVIFRKFQTLFLNLIILKDTDPNYQTSHNQIKKNPKCYTIYKINLTISIND